MAYRLTYGTGQAVELDLAPPALLATCAAPEAPVLADPAAAVAEAMQAPLDYPPLALALVPGDTVAIALEEGLPQAPAIVAGVVGTLVAGGIEPEHIRIVQTAAPQADPCARLDPELAARVQRVIHDPADKDDLCYLAADADGEAVYLNRALGEADFVLPIACLRPEAAYDNRGPYGSLFPAFSDRSSQQRLLKPSTAETQADGDRATPTLSTKRQTERPAKKRTKRSAAKRAAALKVKQAARSARARVDEVGWLLGARLVVGVVPGIGDDALAVLCGDVDAVLSRARELCRQAWLVASPRRANLVVAALPGNAQQQTWQNVARAVAAARRVVADEGAIALCTELAESPGPSLMRLTESRDLDDALARISDDEEFDSAAAAQLGEALRQGPVYLLSQLDPEFVEQLGLAPVSGPEQIARLASRAASCIAVPGAQYALPAIVSDDADALDSDDEP